MLDALNRRMARNRQAELWVGYPKDGRTIAPIFLQKAGFLTTDQIERVDDYRVISFQGMWPNDIGLRIFELKPQMIAEALGQNTLDCAIIGRDVAKEFNLAVNNEGRKGLQQITEILDTGLGKCALMIAVKEWDRAITAQDLNGRVIATKYPNLVANWAKKNNVQFTEIISQGICGGLEGYDVLDPSVTVIADMVETGKSLALNEWRPLGISDRNWSAIRDGAFNSRNTSDAARFINLRPAFIQKAAGCILWSTAIAVRNNTPLSEPKAKAREVLIEKFDLSAIRLGAKFSTQTPTSHGALLYG